MLGTDGEGSRDTRDLTSSLSHSQNNYFAEMRGGSEEGSFLRLMDFVSVNSRLKRKEEEKKDSQNHILAWNTVQVFLDRKTKNMWVGTDG